MTTKNSIQVVFDTRSEDFGNGNQYRSFIDQVNAVMAAGRLYRDIEITQWAVYADGSLVKGEENVHIPFFRHFYPHPKNNELAGGFMFFEVVEDLRRYYKTDSFTADLPDDFELVFTVTATLA